MRSSSFFCSLISFLFFFSSSSTAFCLLFSAIWCALSSTFASPISANRSSMTSRMEAKLRIWYMRQWRTLSFSLTESSNTVLEESASTICGSSIRKLRPGSSVSR